MHAVALLFRLFAALAAIHGSVRVAGHGRTLAGVRVLLDGADRGVTDSAGRYALAGVTMGEHVFQFVSFGYEARRVTVVLADSSDLALDVELTPRPVSLPPLEIVARSTFDIPTDNPVGSTTWHEAGHFRFGADWQSNQPAGGVDVQQAIARLPGVATRGDNANALSIRGGRGSENMILLDGVPLIGAVHFAGAPSAINPEAIALFDVHTGVSSARYDGALAGVISLQTSDITPNQLQLTGALSSTDVRSVVRAPLGQSGGIMLGGRASFRNLFSDAGGLGSTTGYQDFIGASHLRIGAGTLSFVGFESGNHLNWQSYTANPSTVDAVVHLQAVNVPNSTPGVASVGDAANWQSGAFGTTWALPLSGALEWRTTGWWTGNTASITAITGSQTAHLLSGISEFGFKSEFLHHGATSSLLFGGELTRPRTWYTLATPATLADAGVNIDLRAQPMLGSVYGEWDWHGAAAFDIRAGLRANSNFASALTLDPRLVVNLRTGAGTRIEIGFGRTHQSVQSMLNEENLTSAIIGPPLPIAAAAGMPVARSDEMELSFEHQVGRSLTLSLDAYTRNWQNVLDPTATTGALFLSGAPQYGSGNARGIIGSIAADIGRFSVHSSAGLATATQQAGSVTYHTGFEQPWSFSGDVNFRPSDLTSFQFRWTTGAGQARTAVSPGLGWQAAQSTTSDPSGITTNVPGAINAIRLAGPMRLDLSARHLWQIGAGSGARRSGLSTALRLENLLNRPDAIGIMEQPGGSLQLLRGTARAVVVELGWVY